METNSAIFEATRLIISHNQHLSFRDLIEPNLEIFSNFRLMYSSNNTVTNFGYLSLDEIESKCSSLKKFFYGSELLFFSKNIYQTYKKQEIVFIPIDYSLSFDSNVAERFRVYEKGGIVQEKEKLDRLIEFIKDYQFNFDYSFFCLENSEHITQKNERPFNTVRAIIKSNPLNTYPLDRKEAGDLAIQEMFHPFNDEIYPRFRKQRKLIYLVLLKAIKLNWESNEVNYQLKKIIDFCLEKLGTFPKKEIYLAWKLFKYGNSLSFFNPVRQPSNKILSKAKGISWDFLLIDYQSMLVYSMSKNNKFFVPFFASFDESFVKFREACPIKCMLLDDREERTHIFFNDELEFNQDISSAIDTDSELFDRLNDQQQILRRSNLRLDNDELNVHIASLEKAIKK